MTLSLPTNGATNEKRATDQRWLRTRERLLKAGFELIGEAGAEGASIDALVARAGISKQTFYNHFSDREQLTDALLLESRRVIAEAIATANATVADPVQRLARGVAIYAKLASNKPGLAQFVARTTISRVPCEDGNRGLEVDIADGISQARLQVEDVETAVVFVTGVAAMLIAQIAARNDGASVATLCQQTLAMLLRALGCGNDDAVHIATTATRDVMSSF